MHDRPGRRPNLLFAAAGAALLSGLPSTTWAVLTGGDVLAATRAAGTVLPGRRDRPGLTAGLGAHVVISWGWTAVLAAVARRRRVGPLEGAVAGLAIATLDLGIIGCRYPAIRALPSIPQWADHVAFGVVASSLLPSSAQAPMLRAGRTTEGSPGHEERAPA